MTQRPATGPVVDAYPLSPVQEGMLFHHLLAPRSGVDVVQRWCGVPLDLDRASFARAWQAVVERHPVLRTSFRWEGLPAPLQQIHEWANAPLEEIELGGVGEADAEARFEDLLTKDRIRGFDLSRPPLFRIALVRVRPADLRFLFTMHHSLFDGSSDAPLFEDVCRCYEAFRNDSEPKLPARRPYRDYIAWLNDRDSSGDEAFWRARLKGFSAPTALQPEIQAAPGSARFSISGQERIVIPAPATEALRAFAKSHGLTLNTLLLGAWSLLLSRYSGEEDVVFGVTRAGRRGTVEGAESMIGMFINTLPLRVAVNPDLSLTDWLVSLRAQWRELASQEQTPLVKIHKWSDVPADRPLFETLVVFEERRSTSGDSDVRVPWLEPGFRHIGQTDVPIMLAGEAGADLSIAIDYDRRRFQSAFIARMVGHVRRVLEGMVEPGTNRTVGSLPLLTDSELHQLLVEWNPLVPHSRPQPPVHAAIAEQAARTPDAVAVRCEDREWTYADLERRATRVAMRLRALGVGVHEESIVGLSLPRSYEMIVALLGILKAGGAFLALDPQYPKSRLKAIVGDARPCVVITEQDSDDLGTDTSQVVRFDELERGEALECAEAAQSSPSDRAYVLYTSGSTGTPNGVEIEHGALANYIAFASRKLDLTPGDRVLQFSALSFDASYEEIFSCLSSGATLVLRNDSMLASAETFLRRCREWGITVLPLPTAYWNHLAAAASRPDVPDCLRLVLIGGEAAQRLTYLKWRQITPGVRLVNGYGPTEACIVATMWEAPSSGEVEATPSLPIGRPIANASAYVLDKRLRVVPVGVAGELHLGGKGLARGYLNRPELTSRKFLPNPFRNDGSRIYKTGDRARFKPDGTLEFLGRTDLQVKVRGFRIELEEVEAALAAQPGVRECVVAAVGGDDSKELIAYVVPDRLAHAEEPPESAADVDSRFRVLASELRKNLQERLPPHMVPVGYVQIERIPLTVNGKVDRGALQSTGVLAVAGSGSPGGVRSRRDANRRRVSSRKLDAMETKLVQIYERVLNVRPVEVTDNFFDLGGHSLLAVRLFSEIEKSTGRKLSLGTIFRAQTVEQLAAKIREGASIPVSSSLVAISPDGSRRPFFCVHSLGGNALEYRDLAKFLPPDQPFFGLQPQGLDGQLPPHHTVEEMAAHYIREIREVQPEGPYRVGGWSFGGVIAFEMGKQLLAAGQEIELLALFDTHNLGQTHASEAPSSGKLRQAVSVFYTRSIFHIEALWKMEARHRRAYFSRKVRVGLHWTAENLRKAYMHVRHPIPEAIRRVEAASTSAAARYLATPYPGMVTLFRAADPGASVLREDPFLGWGEFVLGGIEVIEVPGNHFSLIQGDVNARALAAKLTRRLEQGMNRPPDALRSSATAR